MPDTANDARDGAGCSFSANLQKTKPVSSEGRAFYSGDGLLIAPCAGGRCKGGIRLLYRGQPIVLPVSTSSATFMSLSLVFLLDFIRKSWASSSVMFFFATMAHLAFSITSLSSSFCFRDA